MGGYWLGVHSRAPGWTGVPEVKIVLAAVAQDGGALRHASAELQADREKCGPDGRL